MANPPGSSVVFKTPVQSPIQKALSASQNRAAVNTSAGVWDPHQDPIVGPAAVAGFHLTRSGRVVGQNGVYARGISAQAVGNTGAAEHPVAPPIDPGFGAAPNVLTAGIPKRAAVAPAAKPAAAIAVHVHPTKGITVTHAPVAAAPAAAAAPVVPTVPKPAPGKYSTDSQGRTDTKMNVRTPATSTVTAAAPAAVSSDQATAGSVINSILAPVIKEIQDAASQRSSEGQQAIGGYTTNAENQLKGLDFSTPYAGAAAGENAINTALLARLTGAGSGLQTELAGKLAALNSPDTAARVGGDIASTASGAANAGLAKGDATLSQLLSEGANAKSYGAKLPGITALAGAQDTGKLQGQVTSDEAKQLSDLQSKVPGMVQSELTTLANSRASAAKTRAAEIIAEGYDPATGQLTPKARAELASATGTDPLTGKPTAKTQIAFNKADAAQAKAALAAGKANAAVSKELGYLADDHGNPIKRNGNTIPVATSGTKGFKISSSLATKLSKDAETYYGGIAPKYVPGSSGQVVPGTGPGTQLFYQDAISRLKASALAGGMPVAQAEKLATAIANSYYKPGEGGRPAFTAKQASANSALFPNPLAGFGG